MSEESLPRVAYVTSRGHSGSTLLELLISGHSRAFGMGEIKQMETRRDLMCACRSPVYAGCEFWGRVDAELEKRSGLRLEELNPGHADDETFVVHNRAIARAVAEVSGADLLVDSSKSLGRLQRLVALGVYDLSILYLVRRPEGVAYSNIKRERDWRRYSRTYTVSTMKTRAFLAERPFISVRYEELAREPRAVLEPIMGDLGLVFEEAQLDWSDHESHVVAGNGMRYSEDSVIREDLGWRRHLGLGRRIGVWWLTLPTRTRDRHLYLAHLPYWKGEGFEAWREHRRRLREKKWRRRRHRWMSNHPFLRRVNGVLRPLWRRIRPARSVRARSSFTAPGSKELR